MLFVSVVETVVQADFWDTSVLEICVSKLMYWQQFKIEAWSSISSLKIRVALIALVTESKIFLFVADSSSKDQYFLQIETLNLPQHRKWYFSKDILQKH